MPRSGTCDASGPMSTPRPPSPPSDPAPAALPLHPAAETAADWRPLYDALVSLGRDRDAALLLQQKSVPAGLDRRQVLGIGPLPAGVDLMDEATFQAQVGAFQAKADGVPPAAAADAPLSPEEEEAILEIRLEDEIPVSDDLVLAAEVPTIAPPTPEPPVELSFAPAPAAATVPAASPLRSATETALERRVRELEALLARREEALASVQRTDRLTMLFNRDALLEAAEQELAKSRRFGSDLALALFELETPGTLNAKYGEGAAERLMMALASAMRRTVRQIDVAARVGGGQFAVLCPGTGLSGARRLIEKVLGSLEIERRAHGAPADGAVTAAAAARETTGPAIDRVPDLLEAAQRALLSARATAWSGPAFSPAAFAAASPAGAPLPPSTVLPPGAGSFPFGGGFPMGGPAGA